MPIAQIASFPLLMIVLPLPEEALDVGRRETGGLFTEDRFEGADHLGHGDAFEIERWDQVVQGRHPAQVRW